MDGAEQKTYQQLRDGWRERSFQRARKEQGQVIGTEDHVAKKLRANEELQEGLCDQQCNTLRACQSDEGKTAKSNN